MWGEPRKIDYDLFLRLTKDIPDNLDRTKKKETAPKEMRVAVLARDGSACRMCGLVGKYGNPGFDVPGKLALHHINPNGPAEMENLITLCRYCHCAVHMILYAAGKWRYVPCG